MKFELAEIITKDKLVHQGIFYAPTTPRKKALLWVHGLTSRFYTDPALMDLFAAACETDGYGFAAFNTRGHDYVTSTHRLDTADPKGYVYETIGASVENFTDSVFDIDAAISFLATKGFEAVILVGHSTGANKVCYYAGTQTDPRVAGVVLAGPMSDRYSAADADTNQKQRRIMEQKIKEGKGDEILMGFDFFPLTPKRWMSLLSEGSAEDVFNYRDSEGALATYEKIVVPLCVVFAGSDEHADRPVTEIRKAFDAHAGAKAYKSVSIADADHGFTGKEKEFVDTVVSWVKSI